MKFIIPFLLGICAGYGISQWQGGKAPHGSSQASTPRDVISFTKSSLGDLLQGIGTVVSNGQTKFVSPGGMALECPEADGVCNLEVPSHPANSNSANSPAHPAYSAPPAPIAVNDSPQVIRLKSPGAMRQQAEPDAMETLQTKMGLRSGDVIMSINGSPVDSPSQALTEISALVRRKESLREVTVMRDKVPVRLTAR